MPDAGNRRRMHSNSPQAEHRITSDEAANKKICGLLRLHLARTFRTTPGYPLRVALPAGPEAVPGAWTWPVVRLQGNPGVLR
jgi:hypothetical protein